MTNQINYRIKAIDDRAVFQAYCPICGKPYTLQKDKRTQGQTSIGAHLRDAHGYEVDALNAFVDDCRKIMRREKTERRIKEEQDRAESRALSEHNAALRAEAERKRSLATITLTASDVDEIQSEILSLIGMMEPYYAQGYCDTDARALIDRLEAMLTDAATNPCTNAQSTVQMRTIAEIE